MTKERAIKIMTGESEGQIPNEAGLYIIKCGKKYFHVLNIWTNRTHKIPYGMTYAEYFITE